jgi:hypothetical protein
VTRLQGVVLTGCVLLAGAGIARANVIEMFTDGAAGWQAWTIDDAGRQQWSPADHGQSGDWRGGFISAPVDAGPNRLYALQPASAEPFGNLTAHTMIVDMKTTGVVDAAGGDPTVRFFLGSWAGGELNYFVSTDAVSWNPNDDDDWTTHEIALIGRNFTRWSAQASGNMSFDEVLAHADEIGLVFTGDIASLSSNGALGFTSGDGATVSVDAFATVSLWDPIPEPATLALLTCGGAALLARRKRPH